MHLYHSTQPPGTQLGELQCVCALGRPMEIPAVLSSKQQQPPAQALYVKLKSSLLQAVLEGKSQISLVVGDDVVSIKTKVLLLAHKVVGSKTIQTNTSRRCK